MNTVLISVNSLAKGGLDTLFTPTEAWIFKDDTSVKLTKQGPLWYLPVYGRITDNMKQADVKRELNDYPVMPVGLPPPHPHNNWADYWVIKPYTAMRVHKSARRKLYIPSDCPSPLTELSPYRTTVIKTYPDGITRTVKDIWPELTETPDQSMHLGLATHCSTESLDQVRG